jgi:hypothetical protein
MDRQSKRNRNAFRSVRRIDTRHSYGGYGWQWVLQGWEEKPDGRGEGLSQKHIDAGKTYPMTTRADPTREPKGKTAQMAGDAESFTAG